MITRKGGEKDISHSFAEKHAELTFNYGIVHNMQVLIFSCKSRY